MRFNYALAIAVIPLIIAMIAGSYLVRWLAVLVLGALLAFILFGFEIHVPLPKRERLGKVERKTDVERIVTLIERAKNGKVARSLLEEKIAGIYATLSDDYNKAFHSLASEPNEAIKALRSEGDFLDNLERALKILEEDLYEDRRGKLQR
ncbi:hypothetical protein [Thermococcus thioreducens]|uniref:Uncharacterized protein n=1 Tax=Thermococcus thioreducens TaxID=277988 RepID=A0A0Q2S895_9EURY|nr:hypothetical protein [Thermococcus thioreducens]ASJ11424.1 hypothetical protein A3L14_00330 [Thermococcus thioreducens]KQH83443.1 hypothetical protein AMR53_00335 [Thermococcus thioreducens]SEW06969.1 hypothetical protein SAMN05216170_1373 [Thermococcus thioreducens]